MVGNRQIVEVSGLLVSLGYLALLVNPCRWVLHILLLNGPSERINNDQKWETPKTTPTHRVSYAPDMLRDMLASWHLGRIIKRDEPDSP